MSSSSSPPCQQPTSPTSASSSPELSDLDKRQLSSAHSAAHEVYPPPPTLSAHSHVGSLDEYRRLYNESLHHPEAFWAATAIKELSWFHPFALPFHGSFHNGDVSWFLSGQLNVSVNCIDRHLATKGNKVAIIYEGDEPGEGYSLTFNELFHEVCRFANVLLSIGVRKGDCVAIYLPMTPEAAMAMLACTRVGAVHSVIFAGFSADSVRDRVIDGRCQYVITANEGRRNGKPIPLKATTDTAIKGIEHVKNVIVFQRTKTPCEMDAKRDVFWKDIVEKQRGYCPAVWMDSEDPLFMLYTSGSTGRPKGILHTTAGYLLYAHMTTKYAFNLGLHDDDVHACMADVGWVTGHSYIVYGPLSNGVTTLIFESTPLYPDAGRYWDVVQRHRVTTFYTAPTAIRALMKFPDEFVTKYDRSSLRVLGSVGEPINPEAWRWYYNVCGSKKCAVVDTFWQTETGGHMLLPLPGATPTKPGSACLPFFGVDPVILDPSTGKELNGNDVSGVLCFRHPWPGISRTIFGDHSRYLSTYLKMYPNLFFTGDGVYRDADGYYWITGRVDDVVNVSGHRIGSAEIESALVQHSAVAESAVIGIPHDLKGQSLFAYVIPKNGVEVSSDLIHQLKHTVRQHVGAFAIPDEILITAALPKTRSGKIMRRLLRKIASNETDSLGDISTLADESVVAKLIEEVGKLRKK